METSSYQEEVLSFVGDPGGGNAMINAVAGSGKTEMLRLAARRIQEAGSSKVKIKAVCFNKPAAEQLQARMGRDAECSTLHSVGLSAWTAGSARPEIDKTKTRRIVTWMQKEGEIPRWLPPGKVGKIVSLAKAEGMVPEGAAVGGSALTGLVPDTEDSWLSLFDHYGVETDNRMTPAVLISASRKILLRSIEYGRRILDFDDMLYLPTLTEGFAFREFPWVFVDETQDVSGLQREMVLRMMESGGRLLAVGDKNQAIYGWRGADIGSMDTIARRTSARLLPLPICYRCPKLVCELARKIVPQIEAAPWAEEGILEENRDSFRASELAPGHMIICRNRAPGAQLAYKLMGSGVPVRLMGRNGADGLIALIEGLDTPVVADMLEALEARTDRAVFRAQKRDDEEAVQKAVDDRDTIVAIADGSRAETVAELTEHIIGLFEGPTEGKVMVGTGHASKGLQASDVWILDPGLIPSRGARLPWQQEQEKNLLYVMETRPTHALRFVNSGGLR